MSLLILGGTNDALRLADTLYKKGVLIIYSLAGLVRIPNVEYPVVAGGFSQHGGLSQYISDNSITGIVDVTHPYANVISDTAADAAQEISIPYWQFDRPMWQAQEGDQWFDYADWNELTTMLDGKKSVLITTGRLDQQTLSLLSTKLDAQLIIRTALYPDKNVVDEAYENIHWIKAIGPFTREDETALMEQYKVDALVSKNSGGDATVAKLQAARELQVPVYLLQRPNNANNKNTQHVFLNLEQCINSVLSYVEKAQATQ